MLLTSKPPLHGGTLSPHARASNSAMQYYPPPSSVPRSATSSTQPRPPPPPPPSSSVPTSGTPDQPVDMTQRNLPPMSSVNLPPPDRLGELGAGGSHLPPPPSHQWQQTDDSMWQWLQAKAEEDRRRQEEERTRQENLRLDQRRIEQAMLRDSLQAGVPPHIVPFIFTGLGGGGSQQLAQQYLTQASSQPAAVQGNQQAHHYQVPPTTQPTGPSVAQNAQGNQARSQQSAADYSGDSRTVPPNPYAAQTVGQPPAVQQQRPSSPQQSQYNRSAPTAQSNNATTTSTITTPTTTTTGGAGTTTTPVIGPPSQQAGRLAQINTTEMSPYTPSPNTSVPSAASASSAASQNQRLSVSTKRDLHQQDQHQQQLSPIHFYHWVPPNQSQPNTPASGKPPSASPHSSQPNSHSHLRSEYQSSPKKRKAQWGHQQVPPPPSQLSESTTPQSRTRTSSRGRRGAGHARNKSNSTLPSASDSKPAAHSANNQASHAGNGASSGKSGNHDSSWPEEASAVATTDDVHEANKKDSGKAQDGQKEEQPSSAREVDGDRIGRTGEEAQDAGKNDDNETPRSTRPNDASPHDTARRRSQDVAGDDVSSGQKPVERDTTTEDGDPEGHLSDADSERVPLSSSR